MKGDKKLSEFDLAEMAILMCTLVRVAEARMVLVGYLGQTKTLKWEWNFEQLVQVCARCHPPLFAWLLAACKWKIDADGQPEIELTQAAKSALGILFVRGARSYQLPDGRRVKFGYSGMNRHRRYSIEVGAA